MTKSSHGIDLKSVLLFTGLMLSFGMHEVETILFSPSQEIHKPSLFPDEAPG